MKAALRLTAWPCSKNQTVGHGGKRWRLQLVRSEIIKAAYLQMRLLTT